MILEESLVGNPLVQIVWQRLQLKVGLSRKSSGGDGKKIDGIRRQNSVEKRGGWGN